MFLLILAIILFIAGFIVTAALNAHYDTKPGDRIKFPAVIGIAAAVVCLIISCIAVVPTGYTGILTTFGRVENTTISAGFNFIAPWQSVTKMDNRTQKVEIQTSAFSSDIQQVDLTLSLNYCIDQSTAQELYRTVGKNYYESIIYPRMLENTKAVFSKYTAENLINQRDKLSTQIVEATASDMQGYGITVVSIAIEDIDFTDAFTNAVEAKQVAAQNKLTAETEQAQKTMEEEETAKRAIIAANAKAEQDIIAANADLEVVKIQAEASLYAGEKEAEMNKRISESLTDSLVRYYWIKQWDGKLPTTVLGSDSSYMIDLTD
ncbi:MAG: prohibitin family protein [Acutalibacter sp.]|nr:prohibitin family protein [Acutalibacter sp.]